MASAYSQALRRIKGGVPKGDQEKLISDFPEYQEGTVIHTFEYDKNYVFDKKISSLQYQYQ